MALADALTWVADGLVVVVLLQAEASKAVAATVTAIVVIRVPRTVTPLRTLS